VRLDLALSAPGTALQQDGTMQARHAALDAGRLQPLSLLHLPVRRPKFCLSAMPERRRLGAKAALGNFVPSLCLEPGPGRPVVDRGCGTDVAQQGHLLVPLSHSGLTRGPKRTKRLRRTGFSTSFRWPPAERQTQGQTGWLLSG
jgi:hypothetical protein